MSLQEGCQVLLGVLVIAAEADVEHIDARFVGRFQKIDGLPAGQRRPTTEHQPAALETGATERLIGHRRHRRVGRRCGPVVQGVRHP